MLFVVGTSTHKNDATGNGRPAPLLAEPRYGAAPQPYGKLFWFSIMLVRKFKKTETKFVHLVWKWVENCLSNYYFV